MTKLHTTIGLVSTALLVQACNAGPDTPRPVTQTPQTTGSPQAATSSTSSRDNEYVSMLQGLSQRNPKNEAQQAMGNGERNLMGYYTGRAGLKIPGLTADQQASQTCSLNTLDGLGDVIYGENHLKYRVAMRQFATRFNTAMLPTCL